MTRVAVAAVKSCVPVEYVLEVLLQTALVTPAHVLGPDGPLGPEGPDGPVAPVAPGVPAAPEGAVFPIAGC